MADRVCAFMDTFYRTISFANGERFKSREFGDLFLNQAILIEKAGDSVKKKTVEEHIRAFEDCIALYPQFFQEGFIEKQTAIEYLESDYCVLVKSQYEKRYHNGKEKVVATGYNHITLLDMNGSYQIVSIVWEE